MNNVSDLERLLKLYATHPVNAENILARLVRAGRDPSSVSAVDLAVDPLGEVTDQNHIGGIGATRALAKKLKITRDDHVLDVGCGIGGTTRLLASDFGCPSHGIEISPERYRDAVRLTDLLGLSDRVTFTNEDFHAVTPSRRFSVIVGQGTFVHFRDLGEAMGRCAQLMLPKGRIGIEDTCLRRAPAGSEVGRAASLEKTWLAKFTGLAGWCSACSGAGLNVMEIEDLTDMLAAYLARMIETHGDEADSATELERGGWRLGLELAEAGVIQYFRLVGTVLPEQR